MGEITVLNKATTKSNFQKRDKLNWKIRAEDGELIIVVKPLRR